MPAISSLRGEVGPPGVQGYPRLHGHAKASLSIEAEREGAELQN